MGGIGMTSPVRLPLHGSVTGCCDSSALSFVKGVNLYVTFTFHIHAHTPAPLGSSGAIRSKVFASRTL